MFPYTAAQTADEVVDYMASLGATIDYRAPEVTSWHTYGADEVDESYTFYMGSNDPSSAFHVISIELLTGRIDKIGSDLMKTYWVHQLAQILYATGVYAPAANTHAGDYLIFESMARLLEDAGFDRTLTARVIAIWWNAIPKPIPEADIIRVFSHIAKIASLEDFTVEQHVDVAQRNIPLTELENLLQLGARYPLIADLYPTR